MRSSTSTITSSSAGKRSDNHAGGNLSSTSNSIPVAEIEAIQYYESAAQTPAKYATLNSQCGVLVLHTIRYHPTDTTATKKPSMD